jgi:hypothetical protein
MPAPTPPTNLVVTATEIGKLHLTWDAPAPPLTVPAEYWIFSGTSLAAMSGTTVMAQIGTAVTEYTTAVLGTGVTRYYDVYTATDIGVTNELSTVGTGTESGTTWDYPGAPTALTIEPGDAHVYVLSWVAPVSDGGTTLTDYYLYRGISTGSLAMVHAMTSTIIAAYDDTGLTNGTTYYYAISAVNAVGEGALSTEVSGLVAASGKVFTNFMLFASESIKQLVYSLSGSSSYTITEIPAVYEVLGMLATFSSNTNVDNTCRLVVDADNRAVKVYDSTGLSPKEFSITVILYCR